MINTGTELLLGKVVNTHAAWFGEQLFHLGLRLQRQVCIPDGEVIRDALLEAFPRCDAILVTGGLGPTSDDITREIAAELLEREMHRDDAILEEIREMFHSRNLPMSPSNARQAMVPEGATVLPNPNGTAPGLYLPAVEGHSPHLFLLPGPPRELKPMFVDHVLPHLREWSGALHRGDALRNFKLFGIGESMVAEKLDEPLSTIEHLEIGYCARLGEVDIRCIGPSEALEQAEALVRQTLPRELAGVTEDPLEAILVGQLTQRGETVSTAESCTGGQIATTLTNVDGSSAVFQRGFVTYANEAKREWLGVPEALLAAHGAVSEPVVRAMAEGCLAASGADHALAVSGIAGPGGGTEEKPVGTVYLGLASKGQPTFTKHYFFPSDRISFKLRITRMAMNLLRLRLAGHEPE